MRIFPSKFDSAESFDPEPFDQSSRPKSSSQAAVRLFKNR